MRFWVRLLMGADILGFNGIVHSVIGNVPIDSEALGVSCSESEGKLLLP